MAFAVPSQLTGVPSYTHQVEVHRYAIANEPDEPWDTPESGKPWELAFELVWAVIEPLPGNVESGAGTQAQYRYRLICDPCTIAHQYFVIDPVTGWTYQVVWVQQVADPVRGIRGFASGYGHIEGELERVEGLV